MNMTSIVENNGRRALLKTANASSGRSHRLIPVPPQRWHLTTLSPFLSMPLPSQFLHFSFFLPSGFCMLSPQSDCLVFLAISSVCVIFATDGTIC
jgi:hypothetical protein